MLCSRRGPLRGTIAVPGDKSISHRSLLFSALATSPSRVRGLLDAEDVHATRRAVEAIGARVFTDGDVVAVEPPETLREPGDVVDCGNSGTSLRLLCGVLSAIPGLSVLTGDASLRRRPVRRVVEPLRRMGANLSARDGDRLPPVVVRGAPLSGTRHVLEVASAQVKSACLLAGLFAEGETSVVEPTRSRDHSERMLSGMGVALRVNGDEVTVAPGRPRGLEIDVPGDVSSAAFFLCAAAGLPGSEVTLRGVGTNPTRTGLLDVLVAMGADVVRSGERTVAGEPRAYHTVRGGARGAA
jgi:3-phosphoshikimate 1-carboxyvinyltransferase